MAPDIDILLQDVRSFLELLGRSKELSANVEELRQALYARLQLVEGTCRPSYVDMEAARRMRTVLSDGELRSDHDQLSVSEDGRDSSVDCSMCPESNDDWPPAPTPSCVRPDLSPDWTLSVAAATARALHSGPVYRGGPSRWFRRRCWAALLPGRLLVFTGARANRPRLVLLLRPQISHDVNVVVPTSCCDACCAVYNARPRPGPSFELCSPGRKTHQLWVSDEMEAKRWLEAFRRAAQVEMTVELPGPTRSDVPGVPLSESAAAPINTAAATPDSQREESIMRVSSASQSSIGNSTKDIKTVEDDCLENQQQYESMSANEEIYHDIGVPAVLGPSYANIIPDQFPDNENILDDCVDGSSTRPLYDDICPASRAPEYCNLTASLPTSLEMHTEDDDKSVIEHLYDDIGPITTKTSVYELVQEPIRNLGIRCS